MSAILILVIAVVVLAIGYVCYGGWLAKQWGVDPNRETPSHSNYDGKDYVPANPAVLMGHHFSSIAGAGPINGPIQAAVFGWVPVLLWVVIGGIFFGGMHDFGALFASIRHGGRSIGEVIGDTMGVRSKRLFIVFALAVLILVIASFTSVVAGTFTSVAPEGEAALPVVHRTGLHFRILRIPQELPHRPCHHYRCSGRYRNRYPRSERRSELQPYFLGCFRCSVHHRGFSASGLDAAAAS